MSWVSSERAFARLASKGRSSARATPGRRFNNHLGSIGLIFWRGHQAVVIKEIRVRFNSPLFETFVVGAGSRQLAGRQLWRR